MIIIIGSYLFKLVKNFISVDSSIKNLKWLKLEEMLMDEGGDIMKNWLVEQRR